MSTANLTDLLPTPRRPHSPSFVFEPKPSAYEGTDTYKSLRALVLEMVDQVTVRSLVVSFVFTLLLSGKQHITYNARRERGNHC